jgi:multiple sugar transport system substrate-binding protein
VAVTARHLGLTWDHPRGFNALAAAEREIAPPGLLHWDKQPLEGFESHPIGELAERYDLLVLDHPHVGEAVALDCLLPLERVFPAEKIEGWAAASVGATMESYRWQGLHWALPLDVATQVTALRSDLVGDPPRTWDDVLRLSESVPVALSIAGPHAILSFFSIHVALGSKPGGDDLMDDEIGAEALDILDRLYRRAPPGTGRLNPIGLLNTMATTDAIACLPLVYGYVNYATPPTGYKAIAFLDAPTGPGGSRGSVLGGTGLALTKRARPDPDLFDHLRWLMSPEAQAGFIPRHDGQPSARLAWCDPAVNARSADFYRATLATTEAAWVRPRHDGAIAFQTEASALIRKYLDGGASAPNTLSVLRNLWQRSRRGASGLLT